MANRFLDAEGDAVGHRGGDARTLEEHVDEWAARKMQAGVPAHRCVLPFLNGGPKAVECRLCSKIIYAGEEIKCSVRHCGEMFHLNCAAKDTANFFAESFKCPQHGCRICKQKQFFWRCGRCTLAAHTKCAPWPVIRLKDDQGTAICWRHPSNWLLQNENAELTNSIEEAFCRLPIPYVNEDFKIDSTIRQGLDLDPSQDRHDESVGVSDNSADQELQTINDKANNGARSRSGRSKKHKVAIAIPCIQETGPVYPDFRDEQASARIQEAKQREKHSISRCFDVLDAMDDVSDEIRILASDVFRDATNREIFLCSGSSLRGPWLKKEVNKLHGSQ